MLSRRLKATSLIAVVTTLACYSTPAPHPTAASPLALVTDSLVFHRQGQSPALVRFAVVNRGNQPASVAQCNGQPAAVIDRLAWGNWRFLEGGYCNGGPQPPMALGPGDSLSGVVTVYQGGNYRLRLATVVGGREIDVPSQAFDIW